MSADQTSQNEAYTLRVRDLHVHFHLIGGQVRAVNGVNLYVRRGESVGIGGESGCGKSVTASAIMQLLPSEARIMRGNIDFRKRDGREVDISELKPGGSQMRNIRKDEMAMIFQEPSAALSPLHTVYRQMQEALAGRERMSEAQRREECVRLLGLVGIQQPERCVSEYPFRLSGGMAQRVMIAQALAKNPSLLFADEPTTALDVTVQAQVLKLLGELRASFHISMVFITHNMGILAHMTERIYIMYLGRIVETARTGELFKNPLHPYTRGLISCTPTLDMPRERRLFNIPGTVMARDAFGEGCSFYGRCDRRIPGVCDRRPPPETDLGGEHKVSCHLYGAGVSG